MPVRDPDSPSGDRPSSQGRRFRNQPTPRFQSEFMRGFKHVLWLLGPILLLSLVLIVGVVWAVLAFRGAGVDGPAADAPAPPERRAPPADFVPNGVELASAFIQAQGGRETLAAMTSISTAGKMWLDDKEIGFSQIKRRPDRMLLQLRGDGWERSYGVIGDAVWWSASRAGRDIRAGWVGEPEASMYRDSAGLYDPLVEYVLSGLGSLRSVEPDRWDDRPAWRVSLVDEDGSAFEVFVNPEDYSLLGYDRIGFDGNQYRLEVLEDRIVGGVRIPVRERVFEEGVLIYEISTESVRINPGVMSIVFRPPEGLEPPAAGD